MVIKYVSNIMYLPMSTYVRKSGKGFCIISKQYFRNYCTYIIFFYIFSSAAIIYILCTLLLMFSKAFQWLVYLYDF